MQKKVYESNTKTNKRAYPGSLELLSDEKGVWGFGWLGAKSSEIVSYRADHRGESNHESLLFAELPPYDDKTYRGRCFSEHAVCNEVLDALMAHAECTGINSEAKAAKAGCLPLFRANAERAVKQVNALITQTLDACVDPEALAVARQFAAFQANIYFSLVENGPAVMHLIEVFPFAAYLVFGWWGGQWRNFLLLTADDCQLFDETRDTCNCRELVEQHDRAVQMAKEGTTAEALAEVLELSPCLIKVRPGNCYDVETYINGYEPGIDTEELLREMPESDPEQRRWLKDQLAELDRQFEEELAEKRRQQEKSLDDDFLLGEFDEGEDFPDFDLEEE